jgi:hypothetical protein
MSRAKQIIQSLLEDDSDDPKKHLMRVDPNDLRNPYDFSLEDWLALLTRTSPDQWDEATGPDSGVGVDYWFLNSKTKSEAYINNDQDYLTIEVDGETIYVGDVDGLVAHYEAQRKQM